MTAPDPVEVDIRSLGMGVTHNLLCWLCFKNKAVYSMHPVWVFQPCDECNSQIGGQVKRVRKWWTR